MSSTRYIAERKTTHTWMAGADGRCHLHTSYDGIPAGGTRCGGPSTPDDRKRKPRQSTVCPVCWFSTTRQPISTLKP